MISDVVAPAGQTAARSQFVAALALGAAIGNYAGGDWRGTNGVGTNGVTASLMFV